MIACDAERTHIRQMNGKSQNALRMLWALLLSLAFHASLLYAGQRWLTLGMPMPPLPAVLYARLELPPEEKREEVPVLKNTMKDERAPAEEEAVAPKPGGRGAGSGAARAPEEPKDDESPEFVYPPEAARLNLEGEVVLLVEVDPRGRILDVSLGSSSGHPILDEAALRQVRALNALPGPGHRGKTVLFPVKFARE
jgi:periplasmic protein TonB